MKIFEIETRTIKRFGHLHFFNSKKLRFLPLNIFLRTFFAVTNSKNLKDFLFRKMEKYLRKRKNVKGFQDFILNIFFTLTF